LLGDGAGVAEAVDGAGDAPCTGPTVTVLKVSFVFG
jgi:hypothetical protein